MTREEFVRNRSWILRVIRSRCELTQTEEDYLNDLIEVLEQQPCEDCISRAEAINAISHAEVSFQVESDLNFENYKREVQEIADGILKGQVKAISDLPSIQPTTKENLVVGDCMKREFIEIVVEYPPADLCTYPEYRGKPYFSIKYRENGKTYVGFGTYKIEMLSQWIKEYFMPSIQPKTDEPMQVELEGDGYSDGKLVYDYGKCPKCDWQFEYGDKDWEEPYCCHCGQKLHWFESEDKE